MNEYEKFLEEKSQVGGNSGFDSVWMPDMLFDFQKSLVEWAVRKGRAAIFADCGLGKTFVQLAWAENVCRHTSGKVLILTPLAVAFQTVKEGSKLGVEVIHRREGLEQGDRIIVTNYERLHHFNEKDFIGVVCDESSILKNFDGETRKAVTDFMRKIPYRLLCTATAAPNDYIELGTASEALGDLGYMDVLSRFFKNDQNSLHPSVYRHRGLDFSKLDATAKFRFRGHAEKDFWRWVCSWARAVRKPSDMGFDDGKFRLPELKLHHHVVKAQSIRDGYLFDIPAVGLAEQRSDLRRSIGERCEMVAQLINSHKNPAIAWCNLNEEGNRMAKLIDGAVEVSGNDSEEHKEESFKGFINGDIRVLVTKATIAGFGLNLQHCAHETFFPSHSYEQYYQAIRRCWRFGQKKPVTVDMVTTDGQADVLANLQRKTLQAEKMFDQLVSLMWQELKIEKRKEHTTKQEIPSWL
jgi:hypothetical protein